MLVRILTAASSAFSDCYIKQADDGSAALEAVKIERLVGEGFDFILIDFVMVRACPYNYSLKYMRDE